MYRILIIFFICWFLSLNGFAQNQKGQFHITGKVKVDQGLVEGTIIQIYRNGGLLNNVSVNRTGSFRVAVNIDCIYRFNFINEGYYSKDIEVDTHIPPEICDKDCNFPPYQMAILLYKEVPGVKSITSKTSRISYNPKIDNFDAEILREESSIENQIQDILTEVNKKSIQYDKQITEGQQDKYRRAISDADRLFNEKAYEAAMLRYRDAVLIYPQIQYARNRVTQLYQILVAAELDKTLGNTDEKNFLRYLNYGDQKMSEREYTMAKVAYEKCLLIKPDDLSLKNKLYEANQEIRKSNELALDEVNHSAEVYQSRTVKYNDLIRQGDNFFKEENLAVAKDFYAQAATQIKENSYAILMIQKIDELMSNDEMALKLAQEREEAEKKHLINARNTAYGDALAEADRLFNQRLYRDAIEAYELALTIKNYELYPQNQIRIIKGILADLQLKGDEYNRLIRTADELLYGRKYNEARIDYEHAHQIIPDEKYALQKIAEIDRILQQGDKEATLRDKYNELVKIADSLFQQNNYDKAIEKYQNALTFLPNENYPKEQINIIRGILSRESNEQKRLTQLKTDYDRTISLADNAFNQESYQSARTLYQEALQIIPGQEYPQNQIRKIDSLLKDYNKRNETTSVLDKIDFSNLQNIAQEDREAAYREAMALGESFMKSEDWGVARFYFRRALALIPNDAIALQKLGEVEKQILGDNVNEAKYAEMVKKADEAFKTGDFGVARFYYNKAKEIKANDEYVNERILVVEKLSQSSASRTTNKEFDITMKKAGDAFDVKNYSVARFFYRKALSLKADDEFAKQKLAEVEALINQ